MYLAYLSLYAILFIFFQIIFPLFVSYRKTGIKAGTVGYFPIAIIVMSVLLFFFKEPISFKVIFFIIILGLEIIYYFLILVPLTRVLDRLLTSVYNKLKDRDLFK